MSKGSQQQPTARDRAPAAAPRPQQPPGKVSGNGAQPAPPGEAVKPVTSRPTAPDFTMAPSASEEEDFFARGEINSSFPPSAMDLTAIVHELEDSPESKPLSPAMLERRARLRRVVGGVVGAAALLTGLVGAKALSAPATRVTALQGSLNMPHQVVPSIAIAPPEEPAAGDDKTAASVKVPSPDPAAPSSLDPAPIGENPAAQAAAQPGAESAAAKPVGTSRRLPVIDIELPATNDPAADQQWESAAKNLASQDFKGADHAFAELGKRSDLATRETARLARAAWWTANGRQNEVKPVIADLAANATTPSVRQQARELLSAN